MDTKACIFAIEHWCCRRIVAVGLSGFVLFEMNLYNDLLSSLGFEICVPDGLFSDIDNLDKVFSLPPHEVGLYVRLKG